MALQIRRRHRCYVPNGLLSVVIVDGDSSRSTRDIRLVLAQEGILPPWLIEDLIVALMGSVGEVKNLYRITHAPYRENAVESYRRLTAAGFLSDYRLVIERIFQLRWNRAIYRFMTVPHYREKTRHIRIRIRHEPA